MIGFTFSMTGEIGLGAREKLGALAGDSGQIVQGLLSPPRVGKHALSST